MVSGVSCDKSKIIEAIHVKRGIIEHAAKHIGINPQTIYAWMKKDEDVAKAIEEARENNRIERIDKDENLTQEAYRAMDYLLRSNDVTATIFTMKCKSKWSDKAGDPTHQGYSKTEIVDYSKAADV